MDKITGAEQLYEYHFSKKILCKHCLTQKSHLSVIYYQEKII